MSFDDFPIEDPELFAAGRAFGQANLKRYFTRFQSMTPEIDDLSDFVYPALGVEVLGLVDLVRKSFDRETAAEWLEGLLEFLNDSLSTNAIAVRIEFAAILLDGPVDDEAQEFDNGPDSFS